VVEAVLGRTSGAEGDDPANPARSNEPAGDDRLLRPDGLPGVAEVLGRAGGENFTVASRLLGRTTRERLLSVYGWARLVDQLGDAYPGERAAALDWLDVELHRALGDCTPDEVHPLVARVARTVCELGTGEDELRKLIQANRVDQSVTRYRSFEDLLGYCRLSADPVGRLVLLVFAAWSPQRVAWSDTVCSALQIVEHCQDLAEDARSGRIYLPVEDLDAFGVGEADVAAAAGGDRQAAAALRGVVSWEVARARRMLLDGGQPLVASLRGRARLAVAGFVAGGLAAVDALAASGYNPWSQTPTPASARVLFHMAGLLQRTVHPSRDRSRS
jgi:squalene synthase HpnC